MLKEIGISHHFIIKKIKLFIVRKFSKTQLKFNIVIVQSTEAVTKGVLSKKLF